MAVTVVLRSDADHRELEAGATLIVGWSFVGFGLAGWARMPASRVGPLLVAGGFAWLAGGLDESPVGLVFAAGELVRPLFIPLMVHALLGLPSGRLGLWLDRMVVGTLYAAVVLVGPARFLVSPEPNDECGDCARNPLAVVDNEALLELFFGIQQTAVALGVAATTLLLARRWLLATRSGARSRGPALAAALAAVTYFAALFGEVVIDPSDAEEIVLIVVQIATAAAIPALALVALSRARDGSASAPA